MHDGFKLACTNLAKACQTGSLKAAWVLHQIVFLLDYYVSCSFNRDHFAHYRRQYFSQFKAYQLQKHMNKFQVLKFDE